MELSLLQNLKQNRQWLFVYELVRIICKLCTNLVHRLRPAMELEIQE